ncbi:PhnD/SsuA/transferrin family substrate-binding protein [Alkalispirochaeta sphaeroplastigenens]|uniref:PhnD/SsuA/transferrin family substrate-binding protein n=1 Tax=Alkalispirochaeta sphaeroplastigenens TaxID=1187066 RepID=UPI000CDA8CD0|nr:PhnD/SsuA/transferrin family substrate-binding protein [Alkalispirochaeta sphaeroplastigenens]
MLLPGGSQGICRAVKLLVLAGILCCGTLPCLSAQGEAPFFVGVPALESGRNVYTLWRPMIDKIAGHTERDIRLVIEFSQSSLLEGLRTRRLDLAILDPISAYHLSRHVDTELLAEVTFGGCAGEAGSVRRFALIVPSRSRFFLPHHTEGLAVSVPAPAAHPSAVAFAALIYKDIGLPLPRFEYADTENSILKGVSYSHLGVGLISSHHLEDPELSEFAERVRVIHMSDEAPPWFVVGRSDSIGRTHRQVVAELLSYGCGDNGQSGLSATPQFHSPSPSANFPDSPLFRRAVKAFDLIDGNGHVSSD